MQDCNAKCKADLPYSIWKTVLRATWSTKTELDSLSEAAWWDSVSSHFSITPSHNTTWHLVPPAGPEGKQLPGRRNNNNQKTSAGAGGARQHVWLFVPAGLHRGHMPVWIWLKGLESPCFNQQPVRLPVHLPLPLLVCLLWQQRLC